MKETSGYGLNVVSQNLLGFRGGGKPITDGLSSAVLKKFAWFLVFTENQRQVFCFNNGAHCSFMYGCNLKL
jgi:hypothetical protein